MDRVFVAFTLLDMINRFTRRSRWEGVLPVMQSSGHGARWRRWVILTAAAGAAVVAGWGAAGCRHSEPSLVVACCTSFETLGDKLAEAFMAAHPGSRVETHNVDSATAARAVASRVSRLAVVDAVTLPPEAAGLREVEIGRDGIAVIVHPSNPVATLSLEQVRGLFAGALRNWKDVGGADHPVDVVIRAAGSGTRQALEQLAGVTNPPANVVVQDSSRSVLETIANDPHAIGYLSHALMNARVKDVIVEGGRCTADDIATGRYPLVRPVRLLSRDSPAASTQAFIAFVCSDEALSIIRANGLVVR
jgi:phosphate transport system substrate-binding protein